MGRRVFTKEAPQLAPRDTVCTYHLVYNRDVPESFTREPLMNLLNVVIHYAEKSCTWTSCQQREFHRQPWRDHEARCVGDRLGLPEPQSSLVFLPSLVSFSRLVRCARITKIRNVLSRAACKQLCSETREHRFTKADSIVYLVFVCVIAFSIPSRHIRLATYFV